MNTLERSTRSAAPTYQRDGVATGIAQVARSLVESIPALLPHDRQFLHDVARTEGRYPWAALTRLVGLARQSTNPVHREALAEHLRAASLDGEVPIDVVAAADRETVMQGPADCAVRAFERHATLATKAEAERTLVAHQAAIRTLLDALDAAPVTAI